MRLKDGIVTIVVNVPNKKYLNLIKIQKIISFTVPRLTKLNNIII